MDMPVTERPGQTETQQGQTADRQLDGFEDIADILGNHDNRQFIQKNGYLTADEKQLDRFLARFVYILHTVCSVPVYISALFLLFEKTSFRSLELYLSL